MATIEVRDTTLELSADHGQPPWAARRIDFQFPVQSASYDSASRLLLVTTRQATDPGPRITELEDPKSVIRKRVTAYDLGAGKLRWTIEHPGLITGVHEKRAAISTGKHGYLIDTATGRVISRVPGTLTINRHDMALGLEGDELSRYDIEDGSILWHRVVNSRGSFSMSGDTLFIMENGITAIDLATGEAWSHSIPTTRAILSPGMFQLPERFRERAEHLASDPVVDGDRVYFGADTMIVCLSRASGRLIWSRRIGREAWRDILNRGLGISEPEIPGQLILQDDQENLIVISCGYAAGPKHGWRTDPPSLAIISKEDGRTLARVSIDSLAFAFGYQRVRGGHVVAGSERIVKFDDSLRVTRSVVAGTTDRSFMAMATSGDDLLVRTSGGLVAFGSGLERLWEQPLGTGVGMNAVRDARGYLWFGGVRGVIGIAETRDSGSRSFVRLPIGRGTLEDGRLILVDRNSVTVAELPRIGQGND